MNRWSGGRWSEEIFDPVPLRVPPSAPPVIALHCSGADNGEWRALREALGASCRVTAPNMIGCGDARPWSGAHAFTLMDEARPIIDLVDALDQPAHLIGHSYGGGVALKVATERPSRIASLALYEPSAFHILRHIGPAALDDLAEIEALAKTIGEGIVSGAYHQVASAFVDYWNGPGAWASLRPSRRRALTAWLPKAPLDFQALIQDDTPSEALSRIACPVLLMQGEHALGPSRLIIEELLRLIPNGKQVVIDGAGHMGPITHGADVYAQISAHLQSSIETWIRDDRSKAFAVQDLTHEEARGDDMFVRRPAPMFDHYRSGRAAERHEVTI